MFLVVLLEMRFSWVLGLCVTVSVVVVACESKHGQPTLRDGATDTVAIGSGGNGGSGTAMDSGLAAGGNGGNAYCEDRVFATAVDSGPACLGSSQACDGSDSYVDIGGDGDPIRLAYPMDPSCGTCGTTGCQIWAWNFICCGPGQVTFAACSGSDGIGPCLDLHACGRYVDRNGKTWLATLKPESVDSNAPPGILDLQATVTITDRTTTRTLSVHLHLCGFTSYCGIMC